VLTVKFQANLTGSTNAPGQRRIIDAQLEEAEKGRFRGPFSSADEMIADIKDRLKKRAATKNIKCSSR